MITASGYCQEPGRKEAQDSKERKRRFSILDSIHRIARHSGPWNSENKQMMMPTIVLKTLKLDLFGFWGVATDRDYAALAFNLTDRLWKTIKLHNIPNIGRNIWVYESDHRVFAGVESENPAAASSVLESNIITLQKYAYYKHVGPYSLIKRAGEQMRAELATTNFETTLPYVEIYGHWTSDESLLETELLMALK
ncbi:MAG: GyrI-like domain-containing protein [Chryseolinea sp.]